MSEKHYKNKKRKSYKAIWIVLAILILASGTVGVLAKYRTDQLRQAELISAGFHLSSDYLTETGKEYTITNNTAPIEIMLYNYETENVSLVSQVDIQYTVTVTGGTCTPTSGKLSVGSKAENKLIIQPDSNADEVTVKVTAEPFAYTLQAEFKLSDLIDPELEVDRITDNGDYYLVTIHTGQRSGNLTLTWPDGLIPDKTNDRMRSWSGTSGTLQVDSYSTYELIFFNPNGISGATFNIS